MVLVPRAAALALTPALNTSRYAPGSQASAPFEPNPVDGLSQEAQIHDQTTSYRYDDIGRRQSPRQFGRRADFRDDESRAPFTSLITTSSSEEFATSFGIDATSTRGLAGDFLPLQSISVGIGTYETNARVIHGELPVNGEQLNLTL